MDETRDRRFDGELTRPFEFLVSTTPLARGVSDHMGSPAYSYVFVLEAIRPVLERLGRWRLVDRPESRLAHAARAAEAEGFRPIHLALNPLQDAYLSTAVPNIVFPFWEFPDVPNRDFGFDTRQNWARIARRADLIVTACAFTAEAFRRVRGGCPAAVVPVPIAGEVFETPDWDPAFVWTTTCRHEVWGGEAAGDPEEVAGGQDDERETDAGGLAKRA